MTWREQVVDVARRQLGVKHHHQGRVLRNEMSVGALDCAGLLIEVYREVGIVPPDFQFTDYAKINDGSELHRILTYFGEEIAFEDRQPADCCSINVMGNPQHCGIFTDYGIIHSLTEVVEHHISDKMERRIHKCFRVKDSWLTLQ